MENYPESETSGSSQPINQTAEEKANAAELARQAARQVIDSGKEYAQNAVNAAGKKLTAAKEQMAEPPSKALTTCPNNQAAPSRSQRQAASSWVRCS